MNEWLARATAAVEAYRQGRAYKGYPAPGSKGYCARAARALWTDVHQGNAFPYGQRDADKDGSVSALDMRLLVKRASLLTTAGKGGNAYHTAVAEGIVEPGAFLFFPYGSFGHVAVVVAITASPATDLKHVVCFENTTSRREGGLAGTRLTRLDYICGALGSARVDGVAIIP